MQGNQAHDAHWSETSGTAVHKSQFSAIMEKVHITVILIMDKLLML